MMRGLLIAAGVMLAALAPVAVQSAGQGSRSPQDVFADRCAYCHEAGGWGTRVLARRVPDGEAELLKRSSLPAAYTAAVVRRGIGAMPQFTPTELTDEEIAALADWLDPAKR